MTAEQQNVLIIKGIISELPAVQRETVNEMAILFLAEMCGEKYESDY